MEDNAGCAEYMRGIQFQRLIALRDKLVTRYQENRPATLITGKNVLAGAWCRNGMQKGVDICQIPRFLAIISVNVNGR